MRSLANFCFCLSFLLPSIAQGTMLEWSLADGGNGHTYLYVNQASSWHEAAAIAQTLSHQGQPGYLATITSAAENAFIINNFNLHGFLGGSDEAIEGEWRWMFGPEAGQLFFRGAYPDPNRETLIYSYWGSNEPRDFDNTPFGFPYPGEDYLVYSPHQGTEWNDVPGAPYTSPGFYVEFGPAVPEPGSIVLLGLGMVALVGTRRLRHASKR